MVAGYQADMEAGPNYTGILYEESSRGRSWPSAAKKWSLRQGRPKATSSVPPGGAEDWRPPSSTAIGTNTSSSPRAITWCEFINGNSTVDVVDECEEHRATSGVLALQLHAGPPMTVQVGTSR